MLSTYDGIKLLQSAGAKITTQRVAIMKSLQGRSDHPSAEQLFMELKPDHPTLSIATVYSTAQLLAQASLLRILSIDEKKVYFDPNMAPHGHFMCKKCRKLMDTPVDFDRPRHFEPGSGIASIDVTEVFHYGTCSDCLDR